MGGGWRSKGMHILTEIRFKMLPKCLIFWCHTLISGFLLASGCWELAQCLGGVLQNWRKIYVE